MRIAPFTGVRVAPAFLKEVAAEAYDSLAREQLATLNFLNFLHVSHESESGEEYELAREKFFSMIREGIFVSEYEPCVYVYEIKADSHTQTAIVSLADVSDLAERKILPHEQTRIPKELERIAHLEQVGVDSGPVMLMYRENRGISAAIQEEKKAPPVYEFLAAPGEFHRLWRVKDLGGFLGLLESVRRAVIVDGHHRCAAALAVSRRRDLLSARYLLAAFFPDSELRLRAFNRVVRGSPSVPLASWASPLNTTVTDATKSLRVYHAGKWSELQRTWDEPDATVLARQILTPMFGVGDERSDPRVIFTTKGGAELAALVDEHKDSFGFECRPPTVQQVFEMAENGTVVPPKVTFFYPKVRSGVLVHHHHGSLSGEKF